MAESTFRTMTVEHLGQDAAPADLSIFRDACEAVLPAFDGNEEQATDYIWNNGAWTERLNAGACIYCEKLVSDRTVTPRPSDDETWAELAPEHEADCEWILTRAHWLPVPDRG